MRRLDFSQVVKPLIPVKGMGLIFDADCPWKRFTVTDVDSLTQTFAVRREANDMPSSEQEISLIPFLTVQHLVDSGWIIEDSYESQ